MPAFSTAQLDVAKNHVNWCVTMNNSRSLIGVTKLSSELMFETFAHSTTLISRFADFISKTDDFGYLR